MTASDGARAVPAAAFAVRSVVSSTLPALDGRDVRDAPIGEVHRDAPNVVGTRPLVDERSRRASRAAASSRALSAGGAPSDREQSPVERQDRVRIGVLASRHCGARVAAARAARVGGPAMARASRPTESAPVIRRDRPGSTRDRLRNVGIEQAELLARVETRRPAQREKQERGRASARLRAAVARPVAGLVVIRQNPARPQRRAPRAPALPRRARSRTPRPTRARASARS